MHNWWQQKLFINHIPYQHVLWLGSKEFDFFYVGKAIYFVVLFFIFDQKREIIDLNDQYILFDFLAPVSQEAYMYALNMDSAFFH